MTFPLGPSINAVAIIVGSLIGLMIGSKLPDNIRKTTFHCIGLATLIIGLQMALKCQEAIILIFSLIIGGIIGELLDIEGSIDRFGAFLKSKVNSKNPQFTDGFLNTTILFCIGAMAIIGSLDEGIRGDLNVVLAKSTLDCITSIAMASAYGLGVLFSAFMVLAYQGILVLFAEFLQPFISDVLLNELTAVGGVLIVGIAFSILDMVKIKLANLMPALLVLVILIQIFK